jgi:uncharacterized protein YeaO (DUF488 family)
MRPLRQAGGHRAVIDGLEGEIEMIALKRIYEDPSDNDGFRVLVDRLWPRGMKKEDAELDLWMKEIAPSHDLRKWYGHDTDKWEDFKKRYFKELGNHHKEVKKLLEKADVGKVTLLYAAKDEEHNNAVVLKEFLNKRSG